MARHSATHIMHILGCWLAVMACTTSAASEFLRRSRTSLHQSAAARSQWRTAEDGFLGWLKQRGRGGIPKGCNCQGATNGGCGSGGGAAAMAAMFPPPTTTMPAPAQPPIPPPPPPPPLPGPPPPLPLAPAKPLPGLPGLPGITVAMLPTLGPPPLWKMTPPPTTPPPVTTPPPPTTPGPTTPAWVDTPMGLIAGTTPDPFLQFTTTAPGPAPAPALAAGFAAAGNLKLDAEAGAKILDVTDQTGFLVGRQVVIDGGTKVEEINKIAAFGSIILEEPMVFRHPAGATVTMAMEDLDDAAFAAMKEKAKMQANSTLEAEAAANENSKADLAAKKAAEKARILAEAEEDKAALEKKEAAAKGAVLLQSKGPISFLYRSFNRLTQRQPYEEPCNCPCADLSTPGGVDQQFDNIMDQPTQYAGWR